MNQVQPLKPDLGNCSDGIGQGICVGSNAKAVALWTHPATSLFATGAAIAIWIVFSVLALALQCEIPRPWVYPAERYVGRGAVWYPVVLLNIVTDLVVATIFLPLIRKLQGYLAYKANARLVILHL
jgi:hypothetical protein